MTILGNDFCRFIEGEERASKVDLEVTYLYIGTMQTIISKRMSGDGGAEGNKVLTGLAAVVENYGLVFHSLFFQGFLKIF